MTSTTKGSLEAFKARLLADRPADMVLAEQVITWAINKPLARRWTSASDIDTLTCWTTIGQQDHKILTLETNGLVWILFNQLLSTFPSPDATIQKAFHKHLVGRLGKIPGGNTSAASYKSKASWRLRDMDLGSFLEVADWIVVELRKAQVTAVALHAAKRASNR